MRLFVLSLAVVSSLAAISGLSACSSTGNSAAAVNMMDNPVNACGTDGSSNINDCQGGRR